MSKKPRLTRAFYYATEISLRRNRGALHDANNCAALRRGFLVRVPRQRAQALLDSGRFDLCLRCRSMT